MQIQMQAFGRKDESLRRIITTDLYDHPHDLLCVEEFKNPERPEGWAKINGRGLAGVINVRWHANSRMLVARAIAKKGNRPHELLGVFLAYLIDRHGNRISAINIQLR
jgi:hypothetical protein